jgi:hypothetical protein
MRVLEGKPLEDCARWLGISRSAAEILLLRSSVELLPEASSAFMDEPAAAAELEAALESRSPPSNPALTALWRVLTELSVERAAIRQEQERRATQEAESPGARRLELLRKLAILAILAVSAFLYFRRP